MAGDADTLMLARAFARQHGLAVHQVSERDRKSGRWVPAYVVYRNHVRIGRRRDPAALYRFLKLLVPAEAQCAG